MKIEHVAYPVEDPVAAAKWYVQHLGFTIKRAGEKSPFMHFLSDSSGKVMIEIYNNPKVAVPDYRNQDSLIIHLALVSDNVEADVKRLVNAGATQEGDVLHVPNGDILAMLRDPWGFPIQLCKRSQPMI